LKNGKYIGLFLKQILIPSDESEQNMSNQVNNTQTFKKPHLQSDRCIHHQTWPSLEAKRLVQQLKVLKAPGFNVTQLSQLAIKKPPVPLQKSFFAR